MKILGICFPNDLFYTTLKNDQTSWYGQGIWSILKIMDLVHDPHLKIVTNLSFSSSTHPILQTVQDGKGTTHKQRHTFWSVGSYFLIFNIKLLLDQDVKCFLQGSIIASNVTRKEILGSLK